MFLTFEMMSHRAVFYHPFIFYFYIDDLTSIYKRLKWIATLDTTSWITCYHQLLYICADFSQSRDI